MDEHSLAADPMFVNPARGDFSLRAGSPAFSLGFKAIPKIEAPQLRCGASEDDESEAGGSGGEVCLAAFFADE